MRGEGTEREGPMTSTVLGQSASFPLRRCDVLLEFEGRLKALAYYPRPEGIAPQSDELRVHG